MKTIAVPIRTICGIEELPTHGAAGVTHVLSITDPGWPELAAFAAYGDIRRTHLQFDDIIAPAAGQIMPSRDDVAAILKFGADMDASAEGGTNSHLLVHCHMGVSRSTAAMLTLMLQAEPEADEDELFDLLRQIRPQAWPNSVMIALADDMLARQGRLNAALARHYAHQISAQPDLVRSIERIGRSREIDMGRHATA